MFQLQWMQTMKHKAAVCRQAAKTELKFIDHNMNTEQILFSLKKFAMVKPCSDDLTVRVF